MGLFVFYLGCRSTILAESTYPSQIIYNINIYRYAKPVHHVLSFLPISSHCIFIRPLSLSSVCFYTLQHMSSFILYPVLLFPLFISFYVHFSSSQALSISTVSYLAFRENGLIMITWETRIRTLKFEKYYSSCNYYYIMIYSSSASIANGIDSFYF